MLKANVQTVIIFGRIRLQHQRVYKITIKQNNLRKEISDIFSISFGINGGSFIGVPITFAAADFLRSLQASDEEGTDVNVLLDSMWPSNAK